MDLSTGLSGLDRVLDGIRAGDNIVWQVDSIDDYVPFVDALAAHVRARGDRLVYFRFAQHRELISTESGAQVHELHPEAGFETFIGRIHEVIKEVGGDAYYVFDSLSELAVNSYSERMLGNFFRVTCPYLLSVGAVAYFAVLRHYHSYHAAQPIAETTQLLLDVYRYNGTVYVYPVKVENRHSSSMFMLHERHGDEFVPVTESAVISQILGSSPWPGLQSASYRMIGMWDRRFIQAEELLQSYEHGECSKETIDKVFQRQLRQLVSRDSRILKLAGKYLTPADAIYLWKRLIGSGMMGGKAVGMILARAILRKADDRWAGLLEAHDSFFIGSDIFYSFLVENDCWSIRQNQKDAATLLDGAEEARERILRGSFPSYIVARFSDMLDYFGQSPIIVRSSSLLEDNFGNAFSGKYESVFCANQGTKQHRLDEFIHAIRVIYASAMSERALLYRAKRGVLEQDEQMALLVQRVSGKPYGSLFFPHLSGVGFSYNPYVWDETIDPKAGVLRLVFGLGTRAVNRHDDDYTRLVALNAPERRPEVGFDELARYSQKEADVLDLVHDSFSTACFADICGEISDVPLELFATRERRSTGQGKREHWVLTFDGALCGTQLVSDMHEMLGILSDGYGSHVDIEFTVNFASDGSYRINLLQCRPLQIREDLLTVPALPSIDEGQAIMTVQGGIVGHSRRVYLDCLIYLEPEAYAVLSETQRYSVARLVGKLTHSAQRSGLEAVMLLGPGRWGTSTPSLGIPVSFAEINTVCILCEITSREEGLSPDLSLGTHFFGDLVEMDMLYLGFVSGKEGNVLNKDFFSTAPNRLTELLAESSAWSGLVKVVEAPPGKRIVMHADTMRQRAMVWISEQP